MTPIDAVLFDYSGTLFRLEEDEPWFHGMKINTVDERQVDDLPVLGIDAVT